MEENLSSREDNSNSGIGKEIGDALVTVMLLVQLLRKQPGFDDDKFQQGLQEYLDDPGLSTTARGAFLALLGEGEKLAELKSGIANPTRPNPPAA